MVFWNWLKEEGDALSALASIAAALALVFAYFSFKNTETAVEANLMYQVQKDAREISQRLFGDDDIRSYVLTKDDTLDFPGDVEEKARGLLHELVRFYASIERLNSYDYIEDTYWKNTKEDICDLMNFPNFHNFWNRVVASEGAQFRKEFKLVAERC